MKIEFPHFDILSGDTVYSDHYYLDNKFNHRNGISNKIVKEWRVLEESLPDSIYVRVYENRMDLLRAVIIGTHGTPYHDGLFFFDIVLPTDYPKKPPKVHYHSHGMALNPNLYESGYVCLSLINTWFGSGVELWRPGMSTILQLLVSLQGLVLHDKPFFNEPGHGIQLKSTTKSTNQVSMNYNEVVLIYSCMTMLCNIRNPPKEFKSFVVQHFYGCGEFILAAVMAYANGEAIIGEYKETGSSVSSLSIEVLDTLKSDLMKIHSDLKLAFLGIASSTMEINNSMDFQIETMGNITAATSPLEDKDFMPQVQNMMVENDAKATTTTTFLENKKSSKNHKNRLYSIIIKMLKYGFY